MDSTFPKHPQVSRPDDSVCKGCSASVNVSDEYVAQLLDKVLEREPVALVSEEDYARRMEACRCCNSLQFGTTCRWCGCLVAVKARKTEARCPHPNGSQW